MNLKKGKGIMTITIGLICFVLAYVMFMQFKVVEETNITQIETMRESELTEKLASWKEKYEESSFPFISICAYAEPGSPGLCRRRLYRRGGQCLVRKRCQLCPEPRPDERYRQFPSARQQLRPGRERPASGRDGRYRRLAGGPAVPVLGLGGGSGRMGQQPGLRRGT